MTAQQRLVKVIDLIEDHLSESLYVDQLAESVNWSRWQLQRTFQTRFGYSVAQYYRHRRLSAAAICLIQTEQQILDIALTFGFDNQQSFSRAFNQYFGLAPKRYRLRGELIGLFPRLDPTLLVHSYGDTLMEPTIVTHAAKTLWGMNTRFNAPGSSTPNNMQVLPDLWRRFQIQLEQQQIQKQVFWGVVDSSTANDQLEGLTYWTAFESEKALSCKGMERLDVPEQTYACFIHRGPISEIERTLSAIFRDWLPNSEYRHTGGPELELYDERFAFEHPDSVLEYWVPVEKSVE